MKKAFIIMTFSAMAAGCADNSIPKAQLPELDTSNPLLAEWDTPTRPRRSPRLELSDYEPAFDAAIACSRAEIDAIVGNPSKPTFGNTIVALERHGALLDRISGIFFNLLEADTSDEMQEIALRVQPKLTELSNDISLNPELFARVEGRLRETRPTASRKRTRSCSRIPIRVSHATGPPCPTRTRSSTASIRPSCRPRRSNSARTPWLRPMPSRSTSPTRRSWPNCRTREGGHGSRCQGAR